MNEINAISSRRKVCVGDFVSVDGLLTYKVSRIEGKSLFGYLITDMDPKPERWIVRDYSKSMIVKLFGSVRMLKIKHLDGKEIE